MKNIQTSQTPEQRFDQYIALLTAAVDHPERAQPLRDYCTGLLLPVKRKSMEPIAAQVAPDRVKAKHQSLQQFITDAPWRDRPVLSVAYNYALPALQAHGGIQATLVDDTGIPKKGTHSVGVARQYCGQLGKICTCQVAVSLSLVNEWASLPFAYQLYLPQAWADDPPRRAQAGVPEELEFRTKPQLALELIEAAHRAGLALGALGADAAYGDLPDFRDALTALGLPYCVGVRELTSVWPEGKGPLPPKPYSGRGPRPKLLRRDPQHWPVSVKELALSLPEKQYRQLSWRAGARGKLSSRFAAVRVRAAHCDFERTAPRAEEWLLIEWPSDARAPTHYWLATLPRKTSRKQLVQQAKLRFRIERDYEELKQEIGLGHYEGRKWRGFHHHATLCIAAYAFLIAERGFFPSGGIGGPARFPQAGISRGPGFGRSARASGATQSDLDRHATKKTNSSTRAALAALPVLPAKKRLQARDV